jgi:uncharacterized protein (TIGR03067 family)
MSAFTFSMYVMLLAVPAQPEPSDAERLQGEWRIVAADTSVPGQSKSYLGGTIVVRKNGIRWFLLDDPPGEDTFVLDSGKAPKEIDLFTEESLDPKAPRKGIYALEKDRLRLFWRATDEPRPTTFERSRGQHWIEILLTLERVRR